MLHLTADRLECAHTKTQQIQSNNWNGVYVREQSQKAEELDD